MREYNKGEITVIVPCYRAGKYMDNLYDCMQKQTFENFKVILVNDGDKGQTEDLERIAAKDSRIKVVWKENGGASSARNAAINMAESEWIVFVDADDSFEDCYLSNLFNAVDCTDADMGIGGFVRYMARLEKKYDCFIDIDGDSNVMPMKDAFRKILPNSIVAFPWNKIYKTKLIHDNHLFMDENVKVVQDFVFNMQLYKIIDKVSLIPHSGYIYHMEESGSLVASYDKNCVHDRRLVNSMLDELNHLFGYSEDYCEEMRNKRSIILAHEIITNLYKKNSPLSLTEIKTSIQRDVLDSKDIIDVYKANKPNGTYNKLLTFLLLHTNAWFITLFYKTYYDIRKISGNLLYKIR